MILEGNERGFGAELARHLLNPRDNDHVTVHGVEGFVADDLFGAFAEAEAISGATRCRKYLFSLSLNPPPGAEVSVAVFEETIASVEHQLGLTGQPRAVVFHEKTGRRHAHCVWSRIDVASMKAVQLSHYKRKLMALSREIYLQHDWEMPEGFKDPAKRDLLTYSRQEAGQARRERRDPKAMKALFRGCWAVSDSRAGFEAALREQGFLLARGDRRGFVAVDAAGKIWSLSRWCGVNPQEMRARLGPEAALPSVEEVRDQLSSLPKQPIDPRDAVFEARRAKLVAAQRAERTALLKAQEDQSSAEIRARQARLPKGLKGLLSRATGRYQTILRRYELEVDAAKQRDRTVQQALVRKHLDERQALSHAARRQGLPSAFQSKTQADPQQALVLKDNRLAPSKDQLIQSPELILDHISQSKASFTRTDVLRGLSSCINDPSTLSKAADSALASREAVKLPGDSADASGVHYTTLDYQLAEDALHTNAHILAQSQGKRVDQTHVSAAIGQQNAAMRRAFGGSLSSEQTAAIQQVLGDGQFAQIVGLAGAGKSTMLATAAQAWRREGINVHGAALAGKAADGLQEASNIPSRTLASIEMSWQNGYDPIAKGDVLVIDEAGMIGTRQLSRITAKMQEIGAKLVLVGDPDQLQPIEAGTPFRDLVARHGAVQLSEIHRQKEDWQKQASRDLAEGQTAKAVQTYKTRGAVTEAQDTSEAIEALVETYTMDVAANGNDRSRLAFAHRRKDVHALNQGIRAALRDEPDNDVLIQTETGPRAFAPGDRMVFGKNDKELGVKNGMLGTVEHVSGGSMKVALDGNTQRTVSFDPNSYRHMDHGYATTIHKSQGATVDQAYVLASRTMDSHLTYVAMTRHREELRVFTSHEDRPS